MTQESRLGLSAAIRRFTYTMCTYPWDKIYGLLGIVQDEHGVQPDYHLPFAASRDIGFLAIA